MENFTTEALAISVGHDYRPMQVALDAIEWSPKPGPALPVRAADGPRTGEGLEAIHAIAAQTQRALWSGDQVVGYLDLVLDIDFDGGLRRSLWVEVKVNAGESGDQLATYSTYAAQEPVPPIIVTLARSRLSSGYPSLLWSDIAAAVGGTPSPHPAWVSLLEFLSEERIVGPSAPLPADIDGCIQVVLDVNQCISRMWPDAVNTLSWKHTGALRKNLRTYLESQGIEGSGGPLRFGLIQAGRSWQWALRVTTGNYEKVPLDRERMLRDAEVGLLPADWERLSTGPTVLQRKEALEKFVSHDEVIEWFDNGLRQLRDARVLDRYLHGLPRPG